MNKFESIFVNNGNINTPSLSFISNPSSGFSMNPEGPMNCSIKGIPILKCYDKYLEIPYGLKINQNYEKNKILICD